MQFARINSNKNQLILMAHFIKFSENPAVNLLKKSESNQTPVGYLMT